MDKVVIDKIREDLNTKFNTKEEAAQIIAEIYGDMTADEVLEQDEFYFSTNGFTEYILNLMEIDNYEKIEDEKKDTVLLKNIVDAAKLYYVVKCLQEEGQVGNVDYGVCSWCKKPVRFFSDKVYEEEYELNGQCEECQNKTWNK